MWDRRAAADGPYCSNLDSGTDCTSILHILHSSPLRRARVNEREGPGCPDGCFPRGAWVLRPATEVGRPTCMWDRRPAWLAVLYEPRIWYWLYLDSAYSTVVLCITFIKCIFGWANLEFCKELFKKIWIVLIIFLDLY